MKRNLWCCFPSKTDTTKVTKMKEPVLVLLLLCICFGGTCCIYLQHRNTSALLWWDLLYITAILLVCLLACLLATDQSKADMGHHPPQHNTFALN
jgi:cytochrome bd-type quinol oxidase subunit 2